MYDDKKQLRQTCPDVFSIEFEDGTVLEYDQAVSTGSLKIKGGVPSIAISPEGVTFVANTIFDGTVNITGAVTLDDVLNGAKTANFMGTVAPLWVAQRRWGKALRC